MFPLRAPPRRGFFYITPSSAKARTENVLRVGPFVNIVLGERVERAVKRTPEERAFSLVSKCKTLMLATADKDGWPTVSYAPYVKYWDSYYIYTSALSRHTQDLLATLKASIMFIEDEEHASNIFARKRYTCSCEVMIVGQYSDEWVNVLHCFEKKFGGVFDLIRPLGDFTLFRLDPSAGRYVEGFGRAYHVDADMRSSEHVSIDRNTTDKTQSE